jgi:hypothetical protein
VLRQAQAQVPEIRIQLARAQKRERELQQKRESDRWAQAMAKAWTPVPDLRRQTWELQQARKLIRTLELKLDLALAQRRELELKQMRTWARAQTPSATPKHTLITLLSRFLCERARIEWVGDLCEMRAIWRKQELSSWMIQIRTFGVALRLLVAQLRCMAYDRIFARYWERS